MAEQRNDVFRHGEYRRVISWSTRLKREEPWLRAFLRACPGKRIADFGCGSGEHAAFVVDMGYSAVGIDQSEAQIKSAHELVDGREGQLEFHCSDFLSIPDRFEERFDGALCLGNVLPYLEDDVLDATLAAWAASLREGSGLLLQWLNYTHLRATDTRALPVTIRPGDEAGEEFALIRLMRFEGGHHVVFFPTTLDLPAEWEEGASIRRAHAVRLRSWTHEELIGKLERFGFELVSLEGGVLGEEFVAEGSKDVVIHARRGG